MNELLDYSREREMTGLEMTSEKQPNCHNLDRRSHIRHLTRREELIDVLPIWQELWEQTGSESVFLSPEWLMTWWDQFERGQLSIVMVCQGERLMGLAPWYIQNRWGSRVLRTLGHGFIDYEGVLTRKGAELLVFPLLQQWLCETQLFDEVVFDRLLGDSWFLKSYQWDDEKVICEKKQSTVTSIVDLSMGWEAVLKHVGSNLRSDTGRKYRSLNKSGKLRLTRVSHVEDLRSRFATFLEWKCARYHHRYFQRSTGVHGESGFWGNPMVATYYLTVAEQVLAKGDLAFSCLDFNGKMISAIFGIEKGGTFFYFAPAFCPDYESSSVGRIHIWLLMKELCERGLNAFDFLLGGEEYKRKWRPEIHAISSLRIRKKHLIPYLRSLVPECFAMLGKRRWARYSYQCLKTVFKV